MYKKDIKDIRQCLNNRKNNQTTTFTLCAKRSNIFTCAKKCETPTSKVVGFSKKRGEFIDSAQYVCVFHWESKRLEVAFLVLFSFYHEMKEKRDWLIDSCMIKKTLEFIKSALLNNWGQAAGFTPSGCSQPPQPCVLLLPFLFKFIDWNKNPIDTNPQKKG